MSAAQRSRRDAQPGPELVSYGRFLAHQLGELGMLLGAGTPTALDGARGRLELMLADLQDLYAPLGEVTTCELGDEARAAAEALSTAEHPVVVSSSGSPPKVAADRVLLRALFGHLMRPALATARRGVAFELAAAPAPRRRVTVELSDDAGPAEGEQARARLQLAGGMSGSGLVLGAGVCGPAASRIVALHGGRILVQPGEHGAVVTFDLPAGGA